MLSSINDVVLVFQAVVIAARMNEHHPRSSERDGNNNDLANGNTYIAGSKILLFVGLLTIMGLSITLYYSCIKACRRASSNSASRSRSVGARQTTPRMPLTRERMNSIWSKFFSSSEESSAWPVLRGFASRPKSQVRDVEMQLTQPVGSAAHRARNRNGTAVNSVQSIPTLSAYHATRIESYGHPRMLMSHIGERRAELDLYGLRDSQDRMGIRVDQSFQIETHHRMDLEQPRADLPMIPGPAVQPNVRRYDHIPLPPYEGHRRPVSPTPSVLEPPPPTYNAHTDDDIAYLLNYQNPTRAAEDTGHTQGLPPYAASARSPVGALVNPLRASSFVRLD